MANCSKLASKKDDGDGGGFVTNLCLLLQPHGLGCQTPLSMGFPRQEYGSGLPFTSLGEFPIQGSNAQCPTLQVVSLLTEPPWKP